MSTVVLTRADGRIRVECDAYALELAEDVEELSKAPVAHLSDGAGQRWSELSLLASVNPVGGADETLGVHGMSVDESDAHVVISVACVSSVWRTRVLTLLCTPSAIEASVTVDGEARLDDVVMLGGELVSSSGACGTFRSGIGFPTMFVPNPTEPVQFLRSSHVPSQLGIVGDASPGRLNAVFSPPPLVWALGRRAASEGALDELIAAHDGAGPAEPSGWLAMGLVDAVQRLTFTAARYEPLDGGFLLRLTFEGHTRVEGRWTSPTVLVAPVAGPWEALDAYRSTLDARGLTPGTATSAPWWRDPIFCGWGAQSARAGTTGGAAPDLAREDVYDSLLEVLDRAGLEVSTLVIDDKWQASYGTCEVDEDRWPDLRAWIASQHDAGRKVLLWFKAWDPEGLPEDECITASDGRTVSVDPWNSAYVKRVSDMMGRLLGADGLDADGLKVDFTQRAPSGASLRGSGGAWGMAGLHRLLEVIYTAAHEAKPDALIVTHAVHPSFGDVGDMVRLNDVLERDATGTRVDVALQARLRAAIVDHSQPRTLIDTDQWPMPNRDQWLAYSRAQVSLGVPALYYVDAIDGSGETIDEGDLREIADLWAEYRGRHAD